MLKKWNVECVCDSLEWEEGDVLHSHMSLKVFVVPPPCVSKQTKREIRFTTNPKEK